MSTVVDTLITKFLSDEGDYVRGTNRMKDATGNLNSDMTRATSIARSLGTAVGTGIGILAGTAVTVLGLASHQAAEFDAMSKALGALEGSADTAAMAIERLRAIASRPGLGFEEAVRGFTGLRRAGIDQGLSFSLIEGAGKANALAGGGGEELNRILMALSQIRIKEKVSQEELLQLAEAGFSPFQILKDAFGTADTQELAKKGIDAQAALEALAEGMRRLPDAGDSAKNTFENLRVFINAALIDIGTGLNDALVPAVQIVTETLDDLQKTGALKGIGESIGASVSEGLKLLTAENIEKGFLAMATSIQAAAQYAPHFVEGMSILQGQIAVLGEGFSIFFENLGLGLAKIALYATGPLGMAAALLIDPQMKALDAREADRKARGAQLDAREQARDDALAGQLSIGELMVLNEARFEAAKRRVGEKGAAEQAAKPTLEEAAGSGNSEDPKQAAQLRVLESIEKNTRPEFGGAEAFGGGRLGRMGVTPVELSRMSGGRRGGFEQALAELIGAEMARVIDSRVSDMMRYGALRT